MSTYKNRIRDDLINSGLLKPDSNKIESRNTRNGFNKSKNRKESFDSAIESRRKEIAPKWVKNRDLNRS